MTATMTETTIGDRRRGWLTLLAVVLSVAFGASITKCVGGDTTVVPTPPPATTTTVPAPEPRPVHGADPQDISPPVIISVAPILGDAVDTTGNALTIVVEGTSCVIRFDVLTGSPWMQC